MTFVLSASIACGGISVYFVRFLGNSTATAKVSQICIILYRLFLHPLSAHPGPFLGKCTSWYAAYHSYKGTIHTDILRCHELYGKISPYYYYIYASPSKVVKSEGYLSMRRDDAVSILNAFNREEHAPRRKLLSRAFSTAALGDYVPMIYKTAKIFTDSILSVTDGVETNGEWGDVRDIGTLSSYFTFDVMSHVVFYSPQNLITKTHGRSIVHGIDSSTIIAGLALEQPLLARSRLLTRILLPGHSNNARAFYESTRQFAAERIALEEQQHVDDIFGSLLRTGSKRLSLFDLTADALTMIIAGTDTSSVAISAFFYYTSHYLNSYSRVVTEVRSKFTSADDIQPGAALTSCVYLRACIDEAMRLAPPVAAPLWRSTISADTIDGVPLPAGTDVATSIYSIQRSPALFSDPETFVPERWLPEYASSIPLELSKKAFHPFSLGSRGCIGKNLAYMELTTVLAQIAYRADWRLALDPDGKVDYKLAAHFTSVKSGPMLRFKRIIEEC
ncbi:cytochrome P450 [Boeremia exigua]|uniref:cytochrome P450 n=1 Tax=Boeremia exigua TaxID=749465 RepID=UPI001E8E97DC|nr:cytochrome P450 [Boeremia exigua]KAH6643973.1 cytochrome P450 [Boeremia exigua]